MTATPTASNGHTASHHPAPAAPDPAPLTPEEQLARLTRIFDWLPTDSPKDDVFVRTAHRIILEHDPRTAYEEVTVARLLEGLLRLRAFLIATNPSDNPNDDRRRRQAELCLGRAEASWKRIRNTPAPAKKPTRTNQNTSTPKDADVSRPSRNMPYHPLPGYVPPPPVPDDQPIDWRDYIHIDPAIDPEYAVFKGTNLKVEMILSGLDEGLTHEYLLQSYPYITPTQLRAAIAFETENPPATT